MNERGQRNADQAAETAGQDTPPCDVMTQEYIDKLDDPLWIYNRHVLEEINDYMSDKSGKKNIGFDK